MIEITNYKDAIADYWIVFTRFRKIIRILPLPAYIKKSLTFFYSHTFHFSDKDQSLDTKGFIFQCKTAHQRFYLGAQITSELSRAQPVFMSWSGWQKHLHFFLHFSLYPVFQKLDIITQPRRPLASSSSKGHSRPVV